MLLDVRDEASKPDARKKSLGQKIGLAITAARVAPVLNFALPALGQLLGLTR